MCKMTEINHWVVNKLSYSFIKNLGGAALGITSFGLISGITDFIFSSPKRLVSMNVQLSPLSFEMAIKLEESSTSPRGEVRKVD